MTFAYWCVLIAAFLPIVWVGAAKSRGRRLRQRPAAGVSRRPGGLATAGQLGAGQRAGSIPAVRSRRHHRQRAPAPIRARSTSWPACSSWRACCTAWPYIADKGTLRSLVWLVGFGCMVGLFLAAA